MDGFTSRMAEGFNPYTCGTLQGLLEYSYGTAVSLPRESDPGEESKEEDPVPFMSWSGKSDIITSTTLHAFTQHSLHSREGNWAPLLKGRVSASVWTYFKMARGDSNGKGVNADLAIIWHWCCCRGLMF